MKMSVNDTNRKNGLEQVMEHSGSNAYSAYYL